MGHAVKKVVKKVGHAIEKVTGLATKPVTSLLGLGGSQGDDGNAAILEQQRQQQAEAEARQRAIEEQNRITRENQLILAGSTGTESAEKMGTVNPNATPSTSIGDVSAPKKKKTKGENYSASLGIV